MTRQNEKECNRKAVYWRNTKLSSELWDERVTKAATAANTAINLNNTLYCVGLEGASNILCRFRGNSHWFCVNLGESLYVEYVIQNGHYKSEKTLKVQRIVNQKTYMRFVTKHFKDIL